MSSSKEDSEAGTDVNLDDLTQFHLGTVAALKKANTDLRELNGNRVETVPLIDTELLSELDQMALIPRTQQELSRQLELFNELSAEIERAKSELDPEGQTEDCFNTLERAGEHLHELYLQYDVETNKIDV